MTALVVLALRCSHCVVTHRRNPEQASTSRRISSRYMIAVDRVGGEKQVLVPRSSYGEIYLGFARGSPSSVMADDDGTV